MQAKLFGTSGGQAVEVKSAWPALIPSQGVLLDVVAIVPNVVDSAALCVEQTGKRLHSIAIDQQHGISIRLDCTNIQYSGFKFRAPRRVMSA